MCTSVCVCRGSDETSVDRHFTDKEGGLYSLLLIGLITQTDDLNRADHHYQLWAEKRALRLQLTILFFYQLFC